MTKKHQTNPKRHTKVVKKRVKNRPHPSESYMQILSGFMKEDIKSFVKQQIKEQIGTAMEQLGKVLQNRVNVAIGAANIQTDALERALISAFPKKFSAEDLELLRLNIEDEILGHEVVTSEIKEGDYVRLTLDTEGLDTPTKLAFEHIGKPPHDLGEDFDKQIIGLKVGDTKDIEYTMMGASVSAKVEINRVSRPTQVEENVSSEPTE